MNDSESALKSSNRTRVWFAVLLILGVVFMGYLIADWYQTVPQNVERTFVGRDACVACHQPQADLFHGSHHDLAMDIASNETVLAGFDGQEIEHFGIRSRVFKDGERFMVHTEGPDGQLHDYEVKYVFGVTPLQQYMVELDGPKTTQVSLESKTGNKTCAPLGRVQVLRLSWDTINKKWFYLSPPDVKERIEPNDPLHWTGITQSWNASCAECHSTNVKKNFDPLSRKYSTTFSEIDVSCEACHGPGSLHVELAERKSLFWDRNHGYGLNKLKSTSNLPQIETCAPCHSRRTEIGGATVGCNFDDHYACQLITDQIYHDDGQIRDEDYVYGSFIQSKMFHNGIRCTDCHDPHSTKVKFTDNRLCTSCHQHPAGKYDSISHHHHQSGSTGALCVECHMPATTYMEVDARRDHSLRIPRPDLSVKFGTPNACSACHLNLSPGGGSEIKRPEFKQYLDWIIAREQNDSEAATELSRIDQKMADAFATWYPEGKSVPRTKYYEAMVVGKAANGLPTLMELATDRSAPGMFRASAAFAMADDPSRDSLDVAIKALKDPDAKVVTAALIRIDQEIGRIADRMRYSEFPDLRDYKELVELVAGFLANSSRRIRIEAARVFVGMPVEARQRFSSSEERRAFDAAFDEYRKSLLVQNDRAMTHTMLAGLYEMTSKPDKAMDSYRTAIMVEPTLTGPRANLASILDGQAQALQSQLRPRAGNAMEAGQMQEIVKRIQQLQQESDKLRKEEHELLRIDIERSKGLPGTHGLHYRFAMSSYIQQDLAATEQHLLEAYRQEPDVPTYLLGLAAYYQQQQNPQQAAKYVERLIELDPQHPGYRSLANEISQQLELQK